MNNQINHQLSIFVKLGLLTFWRTALPDDKKVIPLLLLELTDDFSGDDLPEWGDYRHNIEVTILNNPSKESTSSALIRLSHDCSLSLAELFFVALLGEIENSYIVNLLVAELQLPNKIDRPSLHTLNAMAETLFDHRDPIYLDFLSHPLVDKKIISFEREGPLPLRTVKMNPAIWRSLLSNDAVFSYCEFITFKKSLNISSANITEAEKVSMLMRPYYRYHDSASLHDPHLMEKNSLQAILIRGAAGSGRHQFATLLAEKLQLKALKIVPEDWQKNDVLAHLCTYCSWLPVLGPVLGPGEVFRLERVQQPVVILLGNEGSIDCENLLEINLSLPTQEERSDLWQSLINDTSLAQRLGGNALLSSQTIFTLSEYAKQLAAKERSPIYLQHVAAARRHYGAEKLKLLAEPVFRQIDTEAMVLPPMVEEGLSHLVLRANKRETLWKGLGNTLKATPNPGVRALFVGESGTGKTLAASYIATQLASPLYRVDLSSVMNKYIGESEKNLAQLLDEAAANDVVLLFDEADSLFGSRSEGKETGERFANMLTNFLLTRIENHPGVVILTTNSKERIDNAFNRRLDVIIDFPLPGFTERLALWRSHLGDKGPGENTYRNLATYSDFTGGQVRNTVLVASVYGDEHRISNADIWQGLYAEYNKMGRDIPSQLAYLNVLDVDCAVG